MNSLSRALVSIAPDITRWQYRAEEIIVSAMLQPSRHPGHGTPARPTTAEWAGGALLGGLVLVLIAYTRVPLKDQFWVALRWTARWSFVWFFLASWGAALGVLFGGRFRPLAVRARQFGLAFASAHAVHVALVAIMLYGATTPFARQILVLFGTGVGFVYAMALITVSPRLQKIMGPQVWRAFRIVGIEYINYAYYWDFRNGTFHKGVINFLIYAPFLALTMAGPVVRLAAAIKKRLAARDLRGTAAAGPAGAFNPANTPAQTRKAFIAGMLTRRRAAARLP
jgi:hypothetical protein